MPDDKLTEQLQQLLDEFNRDDVERQQTDLEARLVQRAQQYALPQQTEEVIPDDERVDVLQFQLGDERYGVDVTTVRAVRPVETVTRVPSVPIFYRGVTNIRGQIISLLDLRHFFEIPVTDDTLPQEMIVVQANALTIALLADHVEEVATIAQSALTSVDRAYTRGVTTSHLIVLDLDTLLSDDRLIIHGENK